MEEEFFNYGLTSLMEENYKTAIEYFSKSLERKSDDYDVYLYKGHAYFKLGDYASAISDFNQAEKLTDNSFDVLYHRAKAHFFNQDFKSGFTDLNRAKQLNYLTGEQLEKVNNLTNRFS
jgi:tetratricopeptide (TPR) repeat protein